MLFKAIWTIFATKLDQMEKILATNVKRLCKAQNKQLKDLAADMGVDPASLTRAINGNARLDTIERMAMALGVKIKDLLTDEDEEVIEGYIKFHGIIHEFKSREELMQLLTRI